MLIKEMGEFSFIDSIKNETIFSKESVKIGIGDDCAVYIASQEMDQLVTTDTMVEGIHFTFKLMRPYDIGFRLTTANFSDIAAMGGVPKQVLVSIATPKEYEVKDLQGIFDGIKKQCREYNVNIIGGDTVSTQGPLVLTMVVIGEVPKDRAILRSGAKVGDWIGITNTVGSAAVGLDVLSKDVKQYFVSKDAFQRPVPQIELGQFLRNRGVSSMNDISDGLASELMEIAKASHVHLMIQKELIPLHEETNKWAKEVQIDPVDFALYGGEDFQLIFTIDERNKEVLENHPFITFIGQVVEKEEGITLVDGNSGEIYPLEGRGYDHFID